MSTPDWPEDVPTPAYAPPDAELENLAALWREKQRQLGVEAPRPAPAEWTPASPLAAALWRALPSDGRGVEYWRLMHSVAASTYARHQVQVALVGLVMLGCAYCMPSPDGIGGTSIVGRGTDPRCGAHAYRTGAITV